MSVMCGEEDWKEAWLEDNQRVGIMLYKLYRITAMDLLKKHFSAMRELNYSITGSRALNGRRTHC